MAQVPTGRFCWHELMTTDPDAAREFYTALTGWTTEAWPGSETPYTLWINGGRQVGGLMALPPQAGDAPPHWLAYVSTADLGASRAAAESAGATKVWGPYEMDIGKMVGLADPGGAMFALYQPSAEAPGHDDPPAVGEFSWHELMTGDPDGAWDFYSGLFDWSRTDSMDMGEMGSYDMFGRGAHPVGAMFRQPPQVPVPHWLLYIRVPDVDAAAERVRELGGKVLNGPEEVPGGDRIVQCMDPQGAAFAMHSTAA